MADQHNSNIPALTNQVAEDIPDIKENLEFHKDAFERVFVTWSDTTNAASEIDPTVIDISAGFTDGTYTYDFPTNGIAGNSILMLGNSSTIVWMYLNAAPPGWKVLTTGADTVLGVSGGSAAYNENGGTTDKGSFSILTANIQSHTHTINARTSRGTRAVGSTTEPEYSNNDTTINTGGAGGADGLYRPKASIGKLYQLDTA
jgi:hypothetical protein